MADKITKSIEFRAEQATKEIDKLILRLAKTNQMLKNIEKTANGISFEKFVPALESFATSFSKLKAVPANLENISKMAQALNRFKMTAVELNKTNFNVSFAKISQGIYKFTDSIQRMKLLDDTINKISELGRAINRLVSSSIKLQNTKVSFTSLTQAIYKFVGSILRIKDLDEATTKIAKLADSMEKLKANSKQVNMASIIKNTRKISEESAEATRNTRDLSNAGIGLANSFKGMAKGANSVLQIRSAVDKLRSSVNSLLRRLTFGYIRSAIRSLLSLIRSAIRSILSALRSLVRFAIGTVFTTMKRIGEQVYDMVKAYSEYQENINLTTVAYGGLENAAKSLYPFIEKISTAFGLNESEVMRAVGLFKQMANAMGLAQDQGELLAEGLTKMAYDISSLYNITFERALSALQSSLVGEDLPLALVIVLANLFNCVKVLIKWFISKIIRRKVLQLCHAF